MSVSTIILAGLVGTTIMTLVVESAYYLGIAKINLLRALGSLLTRSEKNALVPGLIIHYSIGIFFSLFYATLLALAPTTNVSTSIMLATFAGFVHGLVVGILFTILIAEHHPLVQFKKTGFGDAIAHIFGHGAFGFTVGATLSMMSTSNFLPGTQSVFPFKDVLGYFTVWMLFWGVPLLLAIAVYAPWWLKTHKPVASLNVEKTSKSAAIEEDHNKRAA